MIASRTVVIPAAMITDAKIRELAPMTFIDELIAAGFELIEIRGIRITDNPAR